MRYRHLRRTVIAVLATVAFFLLFGLAVRAVFQAEATRRLAQRWLEESAADYGADMVIEAETESVEDKIKAKFPNGVDRVLVTSPPRSMYDALKIIRFGGIITFIGLHFGGEDTIDVTPDPYLVGAQPGANDGGGEIAAPSAQRGRYPLLCCTNIARDHRDHTPLHEGHDALL